MEDQLCQAAAQNGTERLQRLIHLYFECMGKYCILYVKNESMPT